MPTSAGVGVAAEGRILPVVWAAAFGRIGCGLAWHHEGSRIAASFAQGGGSDA